MLTKGLTLHNRYRIESALGQGGMGAVYRAWDMHLGIWAAVKENFDTSPAAYQQFQREASILARLSHPNLPRVTDHFFLPGRGQYLVMDFIEGVDLETLLQQRRILPEDQVLPWILQICGALAYLHRQSPPIIHRDIKPANIKIRSDNGQAILVDFGIAKFYNAHLSTTMGAKAVTPGYSPPEQYGNGRTDARSDIYALGATLYHLLTGQKLPESVQRMVADVAVPPPRQLNPRIAPLTERVIIKATALSASQRYQKVEKFRSALKQPAKRPPVTPGPSTEQRKALFSASKKKNNDSGVIFIVAALAVIFLILLSIALFSGAKTPAPPAPGTFLQTNVNTSGAATSPTPSPTPPEIALDPADEPTATPNAQLTLQTPEDNRVFHPTEPITLQWDWPLSEGEQFHLAVQGAAGRIADEILSAPEFTFDPGRLPSGAYTWLVLVEKEGAEIARSAPRHFSVAAPPAATLPPVKATVTVGGRPATIPPAQATPPPPAGAKRPAPTLMQPENNASFTNRGQEIVFQWAAAPRPLAADEYYALIIHHREGDDRSWTKDTSYSLQQNDKGWLFEKTNANSELSWKVVIAKKRGNDENEDPSGYETSAYSQERVLRWAEGGGGGGGGEPGTKPTPDGR